MNQANLRDQLATYFSDSELNDLCFDLNIDYQNLPGQTKQEKARELIIYCQHHGLLENLISRCQELRPHLSWEYDEHTPPVSEEKPRKKRISPALLIGIILGTLVIVIGGVIATNLIQNSGFISTPTLPPLPSSVESTDSIVATSSPASSTKISLPVQLPDSPTATIIYGRYKYQYTILSAERTPLASDSYLLHLRIRAWTDSGNGMGFGDDSFRLVAGDVRTAPVNYLNELVERDATVDGDIEFEIDTSLTEAVLVIHYGAPNTPDEELLLIFP